MTRVARPSIGEATRGAAAGLRRVKAFILCCFIACSLLGGTVHAAAAPPAAGDPAKASERLETGRRSLDRADVEPWLDGFMASSLPRGDIAGATVAIAKDGEVLLTKGYGSADTQPRVPVAADRHPFPVASIPQMLTWTAFMPPVTTRKDHHAP